MRVQKEMTKLMLRRRGYTALSKESDRYFISCTPDDSSRAIAYFVQYSKVSIDTIKTVLAITTTEMTFKPVTTIIIVYATAQTPEAKKAIAITAPFTIETFTFDEMAFDILDVVPTHQLVSGPKPREWQRYPIILSTDIVSRYFGFKKGDVVKIDEFDGLTYRRCACQDADVDSPETSPTICESS
jgi:hypothetical protein